jgi:hypothetical protein
MVVALQEQNMIMTKLAMKKILVLKKRLICRRFYETILRDDCFAIPQDERL